MRCATLLLALTIAGGAPAAAQTRRIALDVVTAADGVIGSTVPRSTAVWLDVFAAVRVAEGLDLVARPVLSRRSFDGVWSKQIYQLGVRYERPAASARGVGLRLEVGQMPSPIGIAMLENRSDLNPVVSQHSAYYLPLPRIDPEIPRAFLIAGMYPFGGQATVAARAWDARVAVIDSSPVRGRPLLGTNKPPRLRNTVVGVGVTPRVGLRIGAAVAHGAYASVNEAIIRDRSRGDRMATMVQVEAEWSFRHTRIAGEWLQSTMETARADAETAGGWLEFAQTLTPRLFIAARLDSQHYDYQRPVFEDFQRQRYERVEAIAGFRISPDLTLRAGYLGRKGYVVSHWDDQAIGSIVWQRKIW
jgi:hypothetical protein